MNGTIPHHPEQPLPSHLGYLPRELFFSRKSDGSPLTVTSPVLISMQLNYVMLIFKDRRSFKVHPWLEVSNWSCGLLSPEGWEMRAASYVGRKAIILAFHLIQSFTAAYAFRNAVIFVIICAIGVSLLAYTCSSGLNIANGALLLLQHNQRRTDWQTYFGSSVHLIQCQNCWSMSICCLYLFLEYLTLTTPITDLQ